MPLPELEELYTLYRTDLYRYLCHLTHDPTEAEDILSETFLRAMRRLPTYRGDCAVKTWLFGIARNIWLESLRKRRPDVSADDLLENYSLVGMTEEKVLALLGQPSEETPFTEQNTLCYYLGDERGLISIDSEWLVLSLQDGVVSSADITTD